MLTQGLDQADLGHSASAIDTTAPTNTGHPANGDAYGCSTAETGHSLFNAAKHACMNDRFHVAELAQSTL